MSDSVKNGMNPDQIQSSFSKLYQMSALFQLSYTRWHHDSLQNNACCLLDE